MDNKNKKNLGQLYGGKSSNENHQLLAESLNVSLTKGLENIKGILSSVKKTEKKNK
ncbi:MAG: hypothetical protein ACRCZR_06530 [Cetobacterium sp.]